VEIEMSLIRIKRHMQKLAWIVPTFVGLFILTILIGSSPFVGGGGGSGSSAGASGGAGHLFARINGQEVSRDQFNMELDRIRQQASQFSGGSLSVQMLARMPQMAFEQLLREYAQAAAARDHGVAVSPGDAEREARERIEQQIQEVGKGLKPSELEELRARMRYSINVEAEQRRLAGRRLFEKFQKDARAIEVRVAHVLVKSIGRTEAEAKKLAEGYARQARAGADFAKLARDHSEDEGSKVKGGEVGWASAKPPSPPTDPKAKPDLDAAGNFVPEFTAAALRLKVGQVSDPVKSQFGFHVLKALAERPYTPKDKDSEKDAKKRSEAIQEYQSTLAQTVSQGVIEEYQARVSIEAQSPWLKGYLIEKELPPTALSPLPPPDKKDTKLPAPDPKLPQMIAAYEQALAANGPEVDTGFSLKMADLYQRMSQNQKAADLLDKMAKKRPNAEVFLALGQVRERMALKTEALAAYQDALKNAFNNTSVLFELADRFKALGRSDLEAETRKKSAEQMARQAAEQKRQQDEQKAMLDNLKKEQAEKEKAEKAARDAAAKAVAPAAPALDAKSAPGSSAPASGASPAPAAPVPTPAPTEKAPAPAPPAGKGPDAR
jgi:parvulin-like peptidyl-prolyl isomerase